jgi:hypothetical protein
MTAETTQQSPTAESESRRLGVALFNHTWDLLVLPDRTQDQDDEMLHSAHASRYHWSQAPECQPHNLVVGEWQCARIYATLGRAEPALWHARRTWERCRAAGIDGFHLGCACEVMARAHLVAGDSAQAAHWEARARKIADSLADLEDRKVLLDDIAGLAELSPSTGRST